MDIVDDTAQLVNWTAWIESKYDHRQVMILPEPPLADSYGESQAGGSAFLGSAAPDGRHRRLRYTATGSAKSTIVGTGVP